MKLLVDKKVKINLHPFKRSPFITEAFEMAAREQGWCDTEITLALSQTRDLSLDGKYEVLLHYCLTYGDDVSLTQEDIVFMLHYLGCHTHYLNQKPMEVWDEYDWNNYASLKRKATSSIKRVFAVFSKTVLENEKYEVTTKPSRYFDTQEEANASRSKEEELLTNIYVLWIKQ